MTLSPRARKIVLTVHVSSSVGWFGVVLAYVVLSVAGLGSDDERTVRAVYLAMDVLGWAALVPLAAVSFSSGVLQSLGTPWGLVRHYWVVCKLAISVVATAVLLLYMRTLTSLADSARDSATVGLHELRSPSPLAHAIAAALLLVVATVLSIFKPRGLTAWGWRATSRSS